MPAEAAPPPQSCGQPQARFARSRMPLMSIIERRAATAETYTAHVAAIAALQFIRVYLTPCTIRAFLELRSAVR